MSNQVRNVFISHVHEDDAGLQKLTNLLKDNGLVARDYSISKDNPNNAHDEKYIKTQILAPRIQSCSVLIVYISSKTRHSEYVDWEIEYAHKQNQRIIGVWAYGEAGCKVPKALEDYNDAIVGWTGNNIIDAINEKIDGWTNPDGTPTRERDIARYSCR